MKRILTIILCWLLAFSAIAETTFKAKTAASVAGGYVTSLNKVDGSFEDGIAGWVASTDTIVQTASTEFQGNYKGVWSGTGAGTLDLQWTATASNTYEASAQVNVQGEDDVYVCAYVGTTETGCKLIPALNKIQKVSVVADSVISSAFYLRLKHTGSDAFSIDVDDGKIEPWTPQVVNWVEQESVSFTGYSSGTNPVVFLTKDTQRSNEKNLIAVSTVGSAGTVSRYTVLKPIQATVVAGIDPTASGSFNAYIVHYDSSGTALKSEKIAFANSAAGGFSVSLTTKANTGDYFLVSTNSTPTNNTATNFSITATAISENVVQSYQDGTEWTSYTPTTQGFGTLSNSTLQWKRDGSDLLLIGNITTGTHTSDSAQIGLPNGLVVSSKLSSYSNVGKLLSSYASPSNFYLVTISGQSYLNLSREDQAINSLATLPANTIGNSTVQSINARVPIQGWSSTPTLLALPTSKENRFEAVIANNGTASISSQNVDWINSVSRTALGQVTINYAKLGLTAIPSITLGSLSGIVRINSISTTQAVIYTANTSTLDTDLGFHIKLSKQSPDYTAPGVFVGNVAKNQVATVVYKGTRTQLSTTPVLMPLVSIKGDSFFSISSNKITLQAGEYSVKWTAFLNGSSTNGYSYLQNITDGIEYARSTNFEASSAYSQKDVSGATKFSIAGVKEFGVYVYASNTACYLGGGSSSPNDIQGFIEITKLNGQ